MEDDGASYRVLSIVILTAMVLPPGLAGQNVLVGTELALFVDGGDGIETTDCESSHTIGLGSHLGVPVLRRHLRVELAARVYPLGNGVYCLVDPAPPPRDGTFTYGDRLNLLATHFLTSDVRVQSDRLLESLQTLEPVRRGIRGLTCRMEWLVSAVMSSARAGCK